jgi:hypothetical protein
VSLEGTATFASPINLGAGLDSSPDPSMMWPSATIRECGKIARTLPLLTVDNTFEDLRLHFSVWSNIHEALVLNEYLDMPKNCDNLTAAPAIRLACLYWNGLLISSESTGPSSIAVAGTTLYDAGPAILGELNAIFDKNGQDLRRKLDVIQPTSFAPVHLTKVVRNA